MTYYQSWCVQGPQMVLFYTTPLRHGVWPQSSLFVASILPCLWLLVSCSQCFRLVCISGSMQRYQQCSITYFLGCKGHQRMDMPTRSSTQPLLIWNWSNLTLEACGQTVFRPQAGHLTICFSDANRHLKWLLFRSVLASNCLWAPSTYPGHLYAQIMSCTTSVPVYVSLRCQIQYVQLCSR